LVFRFYPRPESSRCPCPQGLTIEFPPYSGKNGWTRPAPKPPRVCATRRYPFDPLLGSSSPSSRSIFFFTGKAFVSHSTFCLLFKDCERVDPRREVKWSHQISLTIKGRGQMIGSVHSGRGKFPSPTDSMVCFSIFGQFSFLRSLVGFGTF